MKTIIKAKKIINLIIIVVFLCLLTGVGSFIYNTEKAYKISADFISLPLNFNAEDSSSSYLFQDSQITVYGGFIKGIQKEKNGTGSLLIRALSPLPTIKVTGNDTHKLSLMMENINPDFYAKKIAYNNLSMAKLTVNTLEININVRKGQTISINPAKPAGTNSTGKYKYIIMGDNRDGYDTFATIVQQINAENPVFVINNGDLVFSGKPNQYRLFDHSASKIATTLCTTLGNHDIRGNGRDTYTMLYGPPYYSFDFLDSHFIFLDSSPGWVEKTAISNEQYIWLEKDLKKAQGKRIFVISHIPPEDPRTGVTKNEIANYVNAIKNDGNWLENKLNNYSLSKSMNHGFQDSQEAKRFEDLMSKYKVDTVYLSHIHSYLEYTKGGVRYLISGGAGAELLTENSYYHYMIAKIGYINTITIVELPSPANNYLARYWATIQLFAIALYDENPVAVVLLVIGIVLFLILLIIKLYMGKKQPIETLIKWLFDTIKYAVRHFMELFFDKSKK